MKLQHEYELKLMLKDNLLQVAEAKLVEKANIEEELRA